MSQQKYYFTIFVIKICTLSFLFSLLPFHTCNDFANSKEKINGFILLLGPTRSGKSCFINTVTGKELTKVGDDSGDSTTKTSQLYKHRIDGFPEKKEYFFIDTMGLDDSEESEFADHIIFANSTLIIRDLMKIHGKSLESFLIFESLTNDSNQLEKTLRKLKAVFTDDIVKSSIVVLNKNPNPNQKRKERLLQIAKKHKVENIIHWKSGCWSNKNNALHDSYYQQIEYLYTSLNKTKPWTYSDVDNLISQLIVEGKKIYEMQEKKWTGRFRNLFAIGGIGLFALKALNLPNYIAYNIAVWSTEKLVDYLFQNETFLITIAINERIINKFSKAKEDL